MKLGKGWVIRDLDNRILGLHMTTLCCKRKILANGLNFATGSKIIFVFYSTTPSLQKQPMLH